MWRGLTLGVVYIDMEYHPMLSAPLHGDLAHVEAFHTLYAPLGCPPFLYEFFDRLDGLAYS